MSRVRFGSFDNPINVLLSIKVLTALLTVYYCLQFSQLSYPQPKKPRHEVGLSWVNTFI